MTDVLDRPVAPLARQPRGPMRDRRRSASLELDTGVRILLATLAVSAGAIHLAMVPSHWGESVVEGVGFAVTGWLQVAFAVALFARPSRTLLPTRHAAERGRDRRVDREPHRRAARSAHAGHAEDAGFVDVTCVAFEAVLVLGCAALLSRPRLGMRFARGGLAVAGDRVGRRARTHHRHARVAERRATMPPDSHGDAARRRRTVTCTAPRQVHASA